MTWRWLADAAETTQTPVNIWGVIGTIVAAISGIIVAVLSGDKFGKNKGSDDEATPSKVAEKAVETVADSSLEAYDRIISKPMRKELADLRAELDDMKTELANTKAQLRVKERQLADRDADYQQLREEHMRLLASVTKGDRGQSQ